MHQCIFESCQWNQTVWKVAGILSIDEFVWKRRAEKKQIGAQNRRREKRKETAPSSSIPCWRCRQIRRPNNMKNRLIFHFLIHFFHRLRAHISLLSASSICRDRDSSAWRRRRRCGRNEESNKLVRSVLSECEMRVARTPIESPRPSNGNRMNKFHRFCRFCAVLAAYVMAFVCVCIRYYHIWQEKRAARPLNCNDDMRWQPLIWRRKNGSTERASTLSFLHLLGGGSS